MKYSVIFPYRNRLDHALITLPRVHEVLSKQGIDHELIVVEQKDTKKFRRANLLNEGAKLSTGTVLVLHDIDYYPASDDLQYYDGESDVFLPVRRVEFVKNDLTPRPTEDVPAGYRHFKISVDANFFGGISTFTRESFYTINGFSTKFVGWGFEDADLRERVEHYKLNVVRSDNNLFYALEHPDSGPAQDDPDFHRNIHLWHIWRENLKEGILTQMANTTEITDSLISDSTPLSKERIPTLRWIQTTGFDPEIKASPLISTSFNFDEGEE